MKLIRFSNMDAPLKSVCHVGLLILSVAASMLHAGEVLTRFSGHSEAHLAFSGDEPDYRTELWYGESCLKIFYQQPEVFYWQGLARDQTYTLVKRRKYWTGDQWATVQQKNHVVSTWSVYGVLYDDTVWSGETNKIQWLGLNGASLTVQGGALTGYPEGSNGYISMGGLSNALPHRLIIENALLSQLDITDGYSSLQTEELHITGCVFDKVYITGPRIASFSGNRQQDGAVYVAAALVDPIDIHDNVGRFVWHLEPDANATGLIQCRNNVGNSILRLLVRGGCAFSAVNNELTLLHIEGEKLFNEYDQFSGYVPITQGVYTVRNNMITLGQNSYENAALLFSPVAPAVPVAVGNNVLVGSLALCGTGVPEDIPAGAPVQFILSNTCSHVSTTFYRGLYLENVSGVRVQDNIVIGGDGLQLVGDYAYQPGMQCVSNLISGNVISNAHTGITLIGFQSSSSVGVMDNIVTGNSVVGAYIGLSLSGWCQNNQIWNNSFRLPTSSNPPRDVVIKVNAGCTNTLSIAKSPGVNIVGGPYLGGNYWSTFGGTDADGDKLCDQPFVIATNNVDLLPLYLEPPPVLTLAPAPGNPDDTARVYATASAYDYAAGRCGVSVAAVTLAADETDDWQVTALRFETFGSGNERTDVAEARLYRGDAGGTLLGTVNFAADNETLVFPVNETISAGTEAAFTLVYDFVPDKACPCNGYGALTHTNLIDALSTTHPFGQKLQNAPIVGGPTRIRMGELVIVEGDGQYGEAEDPAQNAPLPAPLKLRLAWQNPQTVSSVTYTLIQTPDAAGFLGGVLGQTETQPALSAQGYVQESLTLGLAKGMQNPYRVELGLTPKGEVCGDSWAAPVFTAWGKGLLPVIEAQHDNPANAEWCGTYLADIAAPNAFTLTLGMVPPDYGTVDEVTFRLGSQELPGDVVVPNDVYRAVFDMQTFQQVESLTVTVTLTVDGQQVEEEVTANVKNLPLPAWVNAVGELCHPDSFTTEFDAEASVYRFAFQYPTDFAWSDWVPGDVGLLGGLGNELDIAFAAQADYGVDEQSAFTATVSGQPSLLGTPVGLEGSLTGEFDANFAFRRGGGQLSANVSFDLPERGLSQTFFVLGVPLTVAVDLSGQVDIRVAGGAVLDNQLALEEVTFNPATTVTGNITVSLSALLGVATLAAQGSPSATVEIELTYRTGAGTDATWRGEVVVPVRIYGSLFWGFADAELCAAEFGPWTFGDGAVAMAMATGVSRTALSSDAHAPLSEPSAARAPRLLAAPALASDASGRALTLWIGDTDPEGSAPDPDLFYRFREGNTWGAAAPLLGAASPNAEWESDPRGVFLASGRALAVWTANGGEKTLVDLNAILAHQEIAWSHWDGAAWRAPAYLTDDGMADGSACLAYDAALNRALAVWVRNTAPDSNALSRTSWELWHAVFDPATLTFSTAVPVPGTATGAADLMPALAADGGGHLLLVWARDGDGVFETQLEGVVNGGNVDRTNGDSEIYAARWDGAAWGAPERITPADGATDDAPSVAFLPGGDAIAVWLTRSNGVRRVRYSVRAQAGGSWSAPATVVESGHLLERPSVLAAVDGTVRVLWRGHAPGSAGGGDLWLSEAQAGAYAWTEPRWLSDDTAVEWQAVAALRPDGNIDTMWADYDPTRERPASSAGFSDGVNIGQTGLPPLTFGSALNLFPLDLDSDGRIDYLVLMLPCGAARAGTYDIRGELSADGVKLLEVQSSQTLTAGNGTLYFNVPGGWLYSREADGPYKLRNLRVTDVGNGGFVTAYTNELVTGPFPYAMCAASHLSFDRAEYLGPDVLLTVTLNDRFANMNATQAESVTARLRSSIDPTGIDVALTETGVNTGVFQGVVSVDTEASGESPPRLRVADRASVSAEYNDPYFDCLWQAKAVWRHPVTSHGVPFDWLHRYGLTDAVYETEAERDADNDTFSAWQEYVADTDPTNAASYIRILAINPGPPATVTFTPASAMRVYTLQSATNLINAVWSDVPGQGPRPGAGGADAMSDDAGSPARFYRVRVELP